MNPTQQDLMDAGCWFDSDRAGTAEVTAFKREARWRQHRWAVDELSIHSFGSHRGRRTHPEIDPDDIPNGAKLLDADAAAGANFLTPQIHALARTRVADRQPHQTLDATRLYRDLLSSMPMAFNLFGTAALPEHQPARNELAHLFGVDAEQPSEIVFEWSPARRSPDYTGDRTAFDVALLIGEPTGPRTVVGIETKYHEHSTKEQHPSTRRPETRRRHQEQTDFLIDLAERSGAFEAGWQDEVLTTDLRQIWRDHLLALSMRRHEQLWTDQTRYALVYPRRNASFAGAARRYAGLLVDPDSSFRALVLEDVVPAAFVGSDDVRAAFGRRYLW